MSTDIECKTGSNAHALMTAEYYSSTADRGDTIELSYSDLKLAAKWARYHASRWRRRAAYAAVLAIVAALGVGLPDLNHDGRASMADLGAAVLMIAPALEGGGRGGLASPRQRRKWEGATETTLS